MDFELAFLLTLHYFLQQEHTTESTICMYTEEMKLSFLVLTTELLEYD